MEIQTSSGDLIRCFKDAILNRYLFLYKKNHMINFNERLNAVFSLNMYKNLFINRLQESYLKSTYFSLGGYKIYFKPDYHIEDHEQFLKGIAQVIRETFLFPRFFEEPVIIAPGDVVLDIGANIGTSSLLFSQLAGPQGKVYSFEPVTHNLITKNLKINSKKNIMVIPKAVSDREGQIEIEISDFFLDSSITKREYTKDYYRMTRTIDTITLDSFYNEVGLDRVSFIKLDIEGAEELAIRGAKELIQQLHPKWSVSSYHIDYKNEPQHAKLVNLFKKLGYNIKEQANQYIYAW